MSSEPTKSQVLSTYAKLISIYTVLGIGVLLIFMYFCGLTRDNVSLASINDLTL